MQGEQRFTLGDAEENFRDEFIARLQATVKCNLPE
jgi:hypothetical protein